MINRSFNLCRRSGSPGLGGRLIERLAKRGRASIALLLGCAWFLSQAIAVAADGAGAGLEYKVKAAFLLNFARFAEWPDSTNKNKAPLVIGVVGEDPFAETLPGTISGQTAQGRSIEIRYLGADEPAANLVACHILFLSRSAKTEEQAGILEKVRGHPVLTISDRENFIRQGGMVGFVLVDKRVRFDINLRATMSERLVLSSKLLNVANSVIKP